MLCYNNSRMCSMELLTVSVYSCCWYGIDKKQFEQVQLISWSEIMKLFIQEMYMTML